MSTILQLNFELLFCLTGIQCKSNKSLFYYENAYCKFPDDPIIFMHEALIIVAQTGTFFYWLIEFRNSIISPWKQKIATIVPCQAMGAYFVTFITCKEQTFNTFEQHGACKP